MPNMYAYVGDLNAWVDPLGVRGAMSFIGDSLHPSTVTLNNPGGLIKIQAIGGDDTDKVAVYEKTKIKDVWSKGYRVHHVGYDPKTNEMVMQIVKIDAHKRAHVGGVKDFKKDTGFKYGTTEARAEAARRKKISGCGCG